MTAPGAGPTLRVQSQYQAQAARAREQAQNLPRPARIRFNVTTVGIGESRLTGKSAITFGAWMLEEPTFSWGVQSLDKLALGELPLCTACVLGYVRATNGLYIGVNLGLRVESGRFNVRLKFSVTFEGSTLRSTAGAQTSIPSIRAHNSYTGPATIDTGTL